MNQPPIIVTEAFPVADDQTTRAPSNDNSQREIPSASEEEQTDIVKFLSQLQAINPTRSALLAQVQQLVFQIEHDKRLYPGDKSLLLNESMRATISKLEEDFNKRGFNRTNCPVRRDLMFHYANLYIKYHEVLKEKKSPTPLNAPAVGEEIVRTNNATRVQETSIWEDIRRRRNALETNGNTSNRANTFDDRIAEGRRQRNKDINRQRTEHVFNLFFFISCIGIIYFLIRWMFSPRKHSVITNPP